LKRLPRYPGAAGLLYAQQPYGASLACSYVREGGGVRTCPACVSVLVWCEEDVPDANYGH